MSVKVPAESTLLIQEINWKILKEETLLTELWAVWKEPPALHCEASRIWQHGDMLLHPGLRKQGQGLVLEKSNLKMSALYEGLLWDL